MKTLKTILQEVISGIKAWVDTNTVHKTGNETINGTKTFSAPQCYSSNAILFNSSVLPAQGQVPSATINPLRQYVGYGTSYANSVFIHDTEMRTNGRNHYRWTVYSDDHSANAAMWLVYNPDSEYIRYLDLKGSLTPDANNTYHIGTPDYKWKTLNGVNPGALSLPNAIAGIGNSNTDKQDISGNLVQDQYFNCYFTPRMDGWVYISLIVSSATIRSGFSSYSATLKDERGYANANYTLEFTKSENADTDLGIFAPVLANRELTLYLTFTGYSVRKAYVIPCLGNV